MNTDTVQDTGSDVNTEFDGCDAIGPEPDYVTQGPPPEYDCGPYADGDGAQRIDNPGNATRQGTKKKKRAEKRRVKPSEFMARAIDDGYIFRLNLCCDEVELNGVPLDDVSAARFRVHASENDYGISKISTIDDIIHDLAFSNKYHPIKSFLEETPWDDHDHIGALASYIRTDDPDIIYSDGKTAPVHEVYLKRWAIGAVAKVYSKAQNMVLVIVGPQGCGKSHLANRISSGMPDYFYEGPLTGNPKDLDKTLITKFIWEISELDATTAKRDIASIKAFVSKSSVSTRFAYGRKATNKPAVASFIGTVNPTTGFLSDESGNRRFMCFNVKSINWEYSKKIDFRQFWAQAKALFDRGEPGYLTRDEKAYQTESNRNFERVNPIEEYILKYFTLTGKGYDKMFSASVIQHLQNRGVRVTVNAQLSSELSRAMKSLGIEKKKVKIQGKSRWGYVGIKPLHQSEHSNDENDFDGDGVPGSGQVPDKIRLPEPDKTVDTVGLTSKGSGVPAKSGSLNVFCDMGENAENTENERFVRNPGTRDENRPKNETNSTGYRGSGQIFDPGTQPEPGTFSGTMAGTCPACKHYSDDEKSCYLNPVPRQVKPNDTCDNHKPVGDTNDER